LLLDINSRHIRCASGVLVLKASRRWDAAARLDCVWEGKEEAYGEEGEESWARIIVCSRSWVGGWGLRWVGGVGVGLGREGWLLELFARDVVLLGVALLASEYSWQPFKI
jgi:hypothetical protein